MSLSSVARRVWRVKRLCWMEGTNHFGEEANVRVEFVDGAVGLYAMVVFIHAAAAHEGGGATVAGFGVDHVTVKV